ncbi:DUF4105 domain-containing protein [Rhizobium lusitanum]|uniref:Lnb N-terminal periplasmic domain-containing protein n=1 Tax=Rhizobium lusitanum TaxID=293958 RepID=A0A7X0ISB0_9HYPH|nr:DUF4105 domain-containing protein [Rhizobium lusitanum]MBB6486110.1 hypothetical protein [Rhizobium lusitanum]
MRRFGLFVVVTFLFLAVLLASIWTALAAFYRLQMPQPGPIAVAALFCIFGLLTLIALFTRLRWLVFVIFAATFAAVLIWWSTITPPHDVTFEPEDAQQVTGKIEGDRLVLTGVRNFDWRSKTDHTEKWETRSYDLSKLRSVDLFMSYWAGPTMAHTMMSFGFEDGEQIAWSIEVRYPVGGSYSPIADAFKTDTLIVIAADERDVIGLRINVRGEDVYLYRLKVPPEDIRAILVGYVNDANALAAEPQFYNSITTNCTTAIVRILRLVGANVPNDWRLLVNGYLPGYLYDQQRVDTRLPLAELRERSRINERAKAFGLMPGFSAKIREGVPDPNK